MCESVYVPLNIRVKVSTCCQAKGRLVCDSVCVPLNIPTIVPLRSSVMVPLRIPATEPLCKSATEPLCISATAPTATATATAPSVHFSCGASVRFGYSGHVFVHMFLPRKVCACLQEESQASKLLPWDSRSPLSVAAAILYAGMCIKAKVSRCCQKRRHEHPGRQAGCMKYIKAGRQDV